MKLFIRLTLVLATFYAPAQKNYDQFWEHLFNNDREKALDISEKWKGDNTRELILKEIARQESGKLSYNPDFIKNAVEQEDFANYLYAYWTEFFFFDNYLEDGFNVNAKTILNEIDNSNQDNAVINNAIWYLHAVLARQNNNWAKYNEYQDKMNGIRQWQYCGVFENLNESGLDHAYPPEEFAISEQDFDAKSNGYVNWYDANTESEPYQFFTNHTEFGSGVSYAQTFINAEANTETIFRIGCGSAFKLWLNDKLIYTNEEDVTTDLNAYNVKVNIPKGNNRLLLKVAESNSASYFLVAAVDEQGKPKQGLSYSDTYSPYNESSLEDLDPKKLDNQFETFFEQKVKENPDDFFYTLSLVKTYLRNAKHEEAKKVMKPFVDKYPKSSLIRSVMITVYDEAEDYTEVSELTENITLDDPDYYLPLGLKFADFEKLQEMNPDELDEFMTTFKSTFDLDFLKTSADLMYDLLKNDKVSARPKLDKLMETADKYNVNLKLKFVPVYTALYQEEEIVQDIYESFVDNYFDYSIIKRLAYIYDQKNQRDKTIELISKDLDQLNTDNFYLKDIVNQLHEYQRYKESIEYIDMGLKNFPYSFVLLELKADAYLEMGKKKEAIELYERSLKFNSANNSLRKKIKSLKNENNLLKELVEEEQYDYIKSNRDKDTVNNYGFNILLSDGNIELFEEGGGNYRFVYIYEITSQDGVDSFKEYNLGLSGNYILNKSELVKPDGSVVPAQSSGSNLVFNQLEIGDVVYVDYQNSFSSTGRFYKDYTDKYALDSYHPLTKFSFQVIVPDSKTLNYKVVNGNLEPSIKNKNGYKLYEWVLENPEPIEQPEDYMPNRVDTSMYLHLSTIEGWNNISQWYSDMVRSRIEYDSTVDNVFNTLFPDGISGLSEDERAKIIYDYIREDFSYSYVSFKQSGYTPQKPAKTITSSLGDCKDFSTLFVTLAKKAELDANLVLILTSDYGQNELVLPNTDFNHCIVKVKLDEEEQFLELTDKHLPYKSLPKSLWYATGLEIPFSLNTDAKYDLFVLKDPKREESIFKNQVDIEVTDENLKLNLKTLVRGHNNSYYADLLTEPNFEVMKENVYDEINNRMSEDITLDELKDVEVAEGDLESKFTAELTVNKKLNKIGSLKILQLPKVSNPYTRDIITLTERDYPIDYRQYENVDVYFNEYNVKLPEGQKFKEIPQNLDLKYKDHSYSLTYELVNENNLKVTMKSDPSYETIEPAEYEEFKAYVTKIMEAEEAFIGIE